MTIPLSFRIVTFDNNNINLAEYEEFVWCY